MPTEDNQVRNLCTILSSPHHKTTSSFTNRSTRFLLRQGIAFRGGTDEESNFMQLLYMQSEGDDELKLWLQRSTTFTSHHCYEELQNMMANNVLRALASDICQQSEYAVICDGSRDVSGCEQMSTCIRYVDDNLLTHEEFVGFYQQINTTGAAIAATIVDVLLRINLPLDLLRAQTYDGASNMQGAYNGCQAALRDRQPLALPFHCTAHCINLVMIHAVDANPLTSDSMQYVHELGKMFKRSGKVQKQFEDIVAKDASQSPNPSKLRPLCPTRFLCRGKAIISVIKQYDAVLQCLTTMSSDKNNSEVASKARGLLNCFSQASTLLSLKLVYMVVAPLEELSKAMQSTKASLSGILQCVDVVKKKLMKYRSEECFEVLFNEVTSIAKDLGLEPLQLPRRRVPPARFTGPSAAYTPVTATAHYRSIFYNFLDGVMQQLSDRFNPDSDLGIYLRLERMLLDGTIDSEIVAKYSLDFDASRLQLQLSMLKSECHALESIANIRKALLEMSPDCRRMFSQVEKLLRLLLVCPASTCEAERSFSALRRLKTWLRNSMGQVRLNSAAICHVHKDRLSDLDIYLLTKEFVDRSEIRRNAFGNFPA
jgi:hypothetical protein